MRKSDSFKKEISPAFSVTRSSLGPGTTIHEILEFGNQEVLEIQYHPVFDESGALQSTTNSSIQYKKNNSDRLLATKCETNFQKELVCHFSENLTLSLFLDSEQKNIDSLLFDNKSSTDSLSSKANGYKARWTTQQWIIAFLWWDCFILSNQNSCNVIADLLCEMNAYFIPIMDCDSSGICYCSENKYNCRGEFRGNFNFRRCY